MPSLSPLVLASAALLVLAVVYQELVPLPPPSSPIKLTYFDAPGRAEAARVALRLGGVAFEDERLARDAFLDLKPSLPYGQVPVVTIDGETFAESQAILRFAGRVAGLYPPADADPVATVLVDEILTALDEVNEVHITPTRREKDPAKQKQMRETAVAGPLRVALEKVEKRLEVVTHLPVFQQLADRVLLHEVAVWRVVSSFRSGTIEYVPSTVTDAYTTMNAIHAKVERALTATRPANASSPASPALYTDAKPTRAPTSLKVTYFDFAGRAEPVRLALHIGGVAFEDERLAREAFLERKPTLPYGQVPVLTVDGVQVAQTFALLRFAGALGGLYPRHDLVEALKMDEIIARVEDVYYALAPSGAETDQDKKRAMREQLATERLPTRLSLLDKRIAHWKQASSYALGDEISVADLAVLNVVQMLKSGNIDFVPTTIVDAYPTLVAVHDAVLAHPSVKTWYAGAK